MKAIEDLQLRVRLLRESVDDDRRADENEVAGVAQFYIEWTQDILGNSLDEVQSRTEYIASRARYSVEH